MSARNSPLFSHVLRALALFIVPLPTFAVPIIYDLSLVFTEGSVCQNEFPPSEPIITTCDSAVGRAYSGFLTVDSSALSTDGINLPANPLAFAIVMEDNVWAVNVPLQNNLFVGYFGFPGGFSATTFGIDVVDGSITNIRGGVYGEGDSSSVFFFPILSTDTVPYYFAVDGLTGITGQSPYRYLVGSGTTSITVPEPDLIILLLVGLVVLGCGSVFSRRPR